MEEIKAKIIGNLIRSEMKLKELSQNQFSDKICISQQNLSQIIQGKVMVDPNKIKRIFNELNIDGEFDFGDKKLTNFFDACFDEYYYCTNDKHIKEIDDKIKFRYYSYDLVEYLLLKCIELYHKKLWNDLERLIESIQDDFYDIFNKKQKAVFVLFKAYSLMNKNHYIETVQLINEYNFTEVSDKLQSMAYLLRGISNFQIRETLNALLDFQTAEKMFEENRNVYRAIAASNSIGSCYSQLREYEKAIEQRKKVLTEAERYSRASMVTICYSNIAYSYYKLGKYAEAIKWGKMANPVYMTGTNKSCYITLAWSYYFVGDLQSSGKYMKILLNSKKDKMYYYQMGVLLGLYIHNESSLNKIQLLKKMIADSENEEAYDNVLWCSELLIKEYDLLQDFKELSKCQKKVLNILKWNA